MNLHPVLLYDLEFPPIHVLTKKQTFIDHVTYSMINNVTKPYTLNIIIHIYTEASSVTLSRPSPSNTVPYIKTKYLAL